MLSVKRTYLFREATKKYFFSGPLELSGHIFVLNFFLSFRLFFFVARPFPPPPLLWPGHYIVAASITFQSRFKFFFQYLLRFHYLALALYRISGY